MRRILAAAMLISLAQPATADDWDTGDTVRQVVVTALLAADWYSTVKLQGSPVLRCGWHERNPILGWYPSAEEVSAYFATVVVFHAIVSRVLPRPWREAWQYVTIGAELMEVGHNFQLMLDFKIPL